MASFNSTNFLSDIAAYYLNAFYQSNKKTEFLNETLSCVEHLRNWFQGIALDFIMKKNYVIIIVELFQFIDNYENVKELRELLITILLDVGGFVIDVDI